MFVRSEPCEERGLIGKSRFGSWNALTARVLPTVDSEKFGSSGKSRRGGGLTECKLRYRLSSCDGRGGRSLVCGRGRGREKFGALEAVEVVEKGSSLSSLHLGRSDFMVIRGVR